MRRRRAGRGGSRRSGGSGRRGGGGRGQRGESLGEAGTQVADHVRGEPAGPNRSERAAILPEIADRVDPRLELGPPIGDGARPPPLGSVLAAGHIEWS